MKIVFLSGLYPPQTKGGGEISTYLIAEGLKARGHEVEVITEQNSHLGLLKKPLFERRHSRRIAKRLNKLLWTNGSNTSPRSPLLRKERGPQAVVHAHDFRSALALSELQTPSISPLSGGVVKRESSPDKGRWGGVSVATIRDYAPVCGTTNNILADGSRCHCIWHDVVRTKRFQEVSFPRNYARAWQYWHNTPYRKEAFAKIQHQIFISQAQQDEIKEGMSLENIETKVIYNPVGEDYLKAPVEAGRTGSVLYVGRIEDYKGVGLLLRAWRKIAQEFSYAHLTLVGEGAQRPEYEAWVGRQGLQHRVTFADRVSPARLRSAYDEAEIVAAPHVWTEPFGRAVAEAMARGKTVVAANAGGPGEIIQNEKTGLLFERNSEEALGESLRTALAMRPYDRKEIGGAARAWVAENLTAEKIAGQYEDFYGRMREST